MRKCLAVGLVLLVLSLALLGCKASEALSGSSSSEAVEVTKVISTSQPTGVQVIGWGEVRVRPDIALINLGVEAEAKTAAEAHSKAAQAMGQVMDTLRGGGIAEEDIQTYRFSIQPVHEYDQVTKREIPLGFRVTNLVKAKVREMDKVGEILDAAVKAGGDFIRVRGIRFEVENPKPFYAQAREEAMAKATAKAEELAKLAEVKLGKPIYISESIGYYPPRPMARFERAKALAPPPPTPISRGEQTINLTVQVTFAIK